MKRLAILPLGLVFVLLACGGSVAGDPNGPNGSSSGGGSSSGSSGSGSGQTGSGSKGSTNNEGQCDGIPECNPGEIKVASESACPQDVNCRRQTSCGVTIWCAQEVDQCAAYPSCPNGTSQRKEACPAQTAECFDVSLCGATIHCAKCTAPPPSCDAGDTQVKAQKDCPEDASCYQRTSCGVTIWCTGP